MILLATSSQLASGTDLALTDPRVLGPLAGFIFIIFVLEIVVSGRAYKRLEAENARLRALVEALLPMADKMTQAVEQHTQTLMKLADAVAEPRPRSRRTT